ncbi:MAG: hypothetical protein L0J13_08605, partial [Brevibacterium sp.]|nr:hypothetical protein [Brevibacterium sp.]
MSRPGRGLLGKGAAESVGGGLRYAKLLAQCPPAEVEATRGRNHLGADVSHRIGPMSGHQLVRM